MNVLDPKCPKWFTGMPSLFGLDQWPYLIRVTWNDRERATNDSHSSPPMVVNSLLQSGNTSRMPHEDEVHLHIRALLHTPERRQLVQSGEHTK